ncbi:hypothetical protein KSF_103160 [Reticulibacter mediterranei]|uniref:Uncharacterized protein n=1 Tax=Reticulibacter mediterranei TaxID=2778369 RepID=A0A8J3N914_9CHLR|nr:hypothetical protein [Reticulibacter mediterranei]GHP00269.1 hypothetical protein KSF_103160 [Reticulibacter mediterranei]
MEGKSEGGKRGEEGKREKRWKMGGERRGKPQEVWKKEEQGECERGAKSCGGKRERELAKWSEPK